MSACGSLLSSNRRIDPAVALKDSVRPGSSIVWLVVESAGSLCCSAADGEAGALAARLPAEPLRGPLPDAECYCAAAGASWACRAGPATKSARANTARAETASPETERLGRTTIDFKPAINSLPQLRINAVATSCNASTAAWDQPQPTLP